MLIAEGEKKEFVLYNHGLTRFRTGVSKRSNIDPLGLKPFLFYSFQNCLNFQEWYCFKLNFLKESQQF